MNKPKLLYASPFPPLQSGISDYSTVLIKALSAYFDITLYTDNYNISDRTMAAFPVLKYKRDIVDYNAFDCLIYNIGNNPDFHSYIYETALEHPGTVILHDVVLYYLFVGFYIRKGSLYSSTYSKLGLDNFLSIKEAVRTNGPDLLNQKHMAAKLDMNTEMITSGNKLMVHSEYARNKILETGLIDESRIKHINIICQIDKSGEMIGRDSLFKKYNVPNDSIVISSFGYIADTKLNREICHAVRHIKNKINKKICYVMVGEGKYADNELEDGFIIKTGFTDIEEFNSFIAYSDIIVNLRYPSMGETSGAMMRILQLGKPCITNNGGWFSEIPDNIVYKIDLNDIVGNTEKALTELIENDDLQRSIGSAASDYINNEFNEKEIAKQIYEFTAL